MIATAPYEQGLRFSRKGRHAEAIDCYQQALAGAPSDPRILFALGNTAKALNMPKPAEMFFRQVLAIEPKRVEALTNLSNLLRANGQPEAARALIEPALAQNPQSHELWLGMGALLREAGDLKSAEEHFRRALELKPNYAPALANLADMISEKGGHAKALALYDRVLHQEPDNAQAQFNRAILHLLTANLKQGWRDYAARLKISGKAPLCDHGLAAWAGSSLKNKRLLVTAEQGVGDQLMFASMIPELCARAASEGGSVIVECEKRLVPLFARSFPGAAIHESTMDGRGGVVHAHYGWLRNLGGANLAVEMGTLPRYLRSDIANFSKPHAYLDADDIETLNWQRSLSNAAEGPFIGICWRSGKMTPGRAANFAPLEMWADLIRELPGTPVCVQYDATLEEVEALGALAGRAILHPGGIDQKQELDRACALFTALDAVVSAPTAVSWLSAGAGVPTYKIQRDEGWTSFGCDYEPFAPSALSIVPEKFGDWADSFAKAKAAISRQL